MAKDVKKKGDVKEMAKIVIISKTPGGYISICKETLTYQEALKKVKEVSD